MTKSKESSLRVFQTDYFGLITVLIVSIITILFSLKNVDIPDIVIRIILATTAIAATLLYFVRVRDLPISSNTPFGDTLIALAGIYLVIFLLGPIGSPETVIPLFGSILLIIGGILSKFLLLDRFAIYLFDNLTSLFKFVYRWGFSSAFNLVRIVIWILALITYFEPDTTDIFLISLRGVSYFLFGLPLIMTAVVNNKNNAGIILRVIGIIFAILAVILISLTTNNVEIIGLLFFAISTTIWSISIYSTNKFLQEIYQIIMRFINWVVGLIPTFFHWIQNLINKLIENPWKTIRWISFISSILLLGLGISNPSPSTFITSGILFLVSISSFFIPVLAGWASSVYQFTRQHPLQALQRLSFLLAIVSFFVLSKTNRLNLWFFFGFMLFALSPSIHAVLKILVSKILPLLINIGNWMKKNPITGFQMILIFSSIPAFYFLPESPTIANRSLRSVVPLFLILAGIIPSLYSYLKVSLPSIYSFFKNLVYFFYELTIDLISWIVRIAKNPNNYYVIGSFGGLLSLLFIPDNLVFTKFGVIIISTLSFSFLSNKYLMRLYDKITFGIVSILDPITRLTRYIIQQLSLGAFISFIAWMILLLAFTLRIFFDDLKTPGLIRFGLIIASILVWNIAYDYRRNRLINFVDRLFGGIIRSIVNFVLWIAKNVWLILLWAIAFAFFIISVGLVIPRSIGLVSDLFGQLDYLISLIIGIFMFLMGIFTIRQAIIQRTDLQVQFQGGNRS